MRSRLGLTLALGALVAQAAEPVRYPHDFYEDNRDPYYKPKKKIKIADPAKKAKRKNQAKARATTRKNSK